jgi:hypothetical protein
LWEEQRPWNVYHYSANNPIVAKDPDGKLFDVIVDIAFIAYDVYDIGKTLAKGERVSGTQVAALGADIIGAVVPGLTGGGAAVRAAAHADDAVKVIKGADKAADATKVAKSEGKVGEGIIYKRTEKNGNEKPYVGQVKNEKRYKKRQKEHSRANKDKDYDFEIIDRGDPGQDLNQKEQKHLDQHGGPTNKSNPNGGTSNKKNVIQKR